MGIAKTAREEKLRARAEARRRPATRERADGRALPPARAQGGGAGAGDPDPGPRRRRRSRTCRKSCTSRRRSARVAGISRPRSPRARGFRRPLSWSHPVEDPLNLIERRPRTHASRRPRASSPGPSSGDRPPPHAQPVTAPTRARSALAEFVALASGMVRSSQPERRPDLRHSIRPARRRGPVRDRRAGAGAQQRLRCDSRPRGLHRHERARRRKRDAAGGGAADRRRGRRRQDRFVKRRGPHGRRADRGHRPRDRHRGPQGGGDGAAGAAVRRFRGRCGPGRLCWHSAARSACRSR